jgi:hypothetical protein
MGYGGTTFKILAEMKRAGLLDGVRKLMDLGAQENFSDYGPVADLIAAFGVDPDPSMVETLVGRRFVKYIWERLGVEYHAIEFDAQFETLQLDLNYDDVPPAHRGAYDLVTNCGTTEHVINQLNSFKMIHDLTRHNGLMVHDLPWSGMTSHGLFNYKPTLFWKLCQANGYTWVKMRLRSQVHDPQPLTGNILGSCDDAEQEFYKQYTSTDGGIFVVLRKSYNMPFVSPLDVEGTMVFPDEAGRRRYWTLADPDAFAKIHEGRYASGFPNDEPTHNELRVKCKELEEAKARLEAENARLEEQRHALEHRRQVLEEQIRWMEATAFWRMRDALKKCKHAVLPRKAG